VAGVYRIDQPRADGAWLQTPILAGAGETALFRVRRESWVEVDRPWATPGPVEVTLVHPTFDWPADLWVGCALHDAAGNVHPVQASGASWVRLGRPIPAGPLTLRPLFAGGATQETVTLPETAAPQAGVGQYLRRFEPCYDGVSLSDWRTDDRWQPQPVRILPLTAEPAGTTLTVASTAGLVAGTRWRLLAQGQADRPLTVAAVDTAHALTVDAPVPAAYSLAALARLVPVGLPVEGLTGYYVVDGGGTAATAGNGLSLTDTTRTFTTSDLRVGDSVRLVHDGREHYAVIDTIQSDTVLTLLSALPAGLTGAYYEGVRRYNRSTLHTLTVQVVPYLETLYDQATVEAVLAALSPLWVHRVFSDTALSSVRYVDEQYNVGQVIVDGVELEFLSTIEPPAVPVVGPLDEAYTAGPDGTLLAGPIQHNWALNQYYRAVFNRRAGYVHGTSTTATFDYDAGDTRVWDLSGTDLALGFSSLQLALEEDTLEIVADSTLAAPVGCDTWAQGAGQALALYVLWDDQVWEVAIGEGAATASRITFQAPPDALPQQATLTVAIASVGGLRGQTF